DGAGGAGGVPRQGAQILALAVVPAEGLAVEHGALAEPPGVLGEIAHHLAAVVDGEGAADRPVVCAAADVVQGIAFADEGVAHPTATRRFGTAHHLAVVVHAVGFADAVAVV